MTASWGPRPGAGGALGADAGEHLRVIDLVRAGAIGVVVIGHWLMAAFYVDSDGDFRRADILGLSPWAHPLTWVLQVMPLFFLVGGFVNATSWRHACHRGLPYGAWLRRRLHRLLGPLIPLLVFWAVVAPTANAAGTSPRTMELLTRASLVPTWFLSIYVLVVALVPWTLALWDRAGWWSVALGLVAAGAVDAVSFLADEPMLAAGNVLIVWGTLHQLGYAWRDGALGGSLRRIALGLAGLAGALLLVRTGPYAVSMVGVEGYGANNTNPPRVTLALLGLAQAGLTTAAEPWLRRLTERPLVWRVVATVNLRIMTLYLWHMTAITLLAAVSLPLGGPGLRAEPATAEWWSSRPLWCLGLAALTVLPVLMLGRFEMPRPDPRPAPPAWLPLAVLLTSALVVAALAYFGLVERDGTVRWWLPVIPILAYAALGGGSPTTRQAAAPGGRTAA